MDVGYYAPAARTTLNLLCSSRSSIEIGLILANPRVLTLWVKAGALRHPAVGLHTTTVPDTRIQANTYPFFRDTVGNVSEAYPGRIRIRYVSDTDTPPPRSIRVTEKKTQVNQLNSTTLSS